MKTMGRRFSQINPEECMAFDRAGAETAGNTLIHKGHEGTRRKDSKKKMQVLNFVILRELRG